MLSMRSKSALASLPLALVLLLPAVAAGQEPLPSRPAPLLVPGQRQEAAPPGVRSGFHRAWKNKVRAVRERRAALEAARGPQLSTAQMVSASAALTGTLRVPVIAARYPDQPELPHTSSAYWERLFGVSGPGYSARTYYGEVSGSASFIVTGSVTAWPSLPESADFYRPAPDDEDRFGNTGAFILHALAAVDGGEDFSQYDNDGPDGVPNSGDDDGYVDVAAFLHQDKDAACGGPGIWSHRWVVEGVNGGLPYTTDDPAHGGGFIKVSDYMIQSGVDCADGTSLMPIGTFVHELGHALNLPDLYDTDPDDGESRGIGHWGLMGSGNWNTPDSPAHLSAWSKDYLGWVTVETIGAAGSVVLEPVYQNGRVLRYDLPGYTEYFLLENRQQTLADANLHGPGLLIWHVDDVAIGEGWSSNRVNADATRKGVDLEEADGNDELDLNANPGDAGDPFPGSSAATVFHADSYPASHTNAGGGSGLALSNITMVEDVVSFDVGLSEVPFLVVSRPPLPFLVTPGGTVQRTLEVAASDGSTIAVDGVTAADAWLTVSYETASTPLSLTFTVDATELVEDTHATTVTVTSAEAAEPLVMDVEVTVHANALVLGDNAAGTFGSEDPPHVYLVVLEKDKAVDLAVFNTAHTGPRPYPILDVIAPDEYWEGWSWSPRSFYDGSLLDRDLGSAFPSFVPWMTGIHQILVYNWWDPGPYELMTRPRGSVVVLDVAPWDSWNRITVAGPVGSTALTETIWIRNTGPDAVAWSSHGEGVSLNPSSGTLPADETPLASLRRSKAPARAPGPRGPTRPGVVSAAPGSLRPAGAAPIALAPEAIPPYEGSDAVEVGLSVDVSAYAAPQLVWNRGYLIETPSDRWAMWAGEEIEVRLYDPLFQVLSRTLPGRAWGVAVRPWDGALIIGGGRQLWAVDPDTGVRTSLGGDFIHDFAVTGIDVAPDGSIVFGDVGGSVGRVRMRTTDGSFITLWEGTADEYWVNDVSVAPDGRIFVATGSGLWRLDQGGAARITSGWVSAVELNPEDGKVYFAEGETLKVYDPGTGGTAPLYSGSDWIEGLALASGGSVYLRTWHEIDVIEDGTRTASHLAPMHGAGIALDEGMVYATGMTYQSLDLNSDWLFGLPVDDAPPTDGHVAWVDDFQGLPGTTVTARVSVDVSSAGTGIGNIEGSLTWNPGVATFVALRTDGWQGSMVVNEDDAPLGLVRWAGANSDPAANVGVTTVAEVDLRLVGDGVTYSDLVLALSELGTASLSPHVDLLPGTDVQSGSIHVANGIWGDGSGNHVLEALDALVCLTEVVGGPLNPEHDATLCDVAPDGPGGTFTGRISAFDALVILTSVVVNPLPDGYRPGMFRFDSF